MYRLPVISSSSSSTNLYISSCLLPPDGLGLPNSIDSSFCNSLNLSQQSHLINNMSLISPDVYSNINWSKILSTEPSLLPSIENNNNNQNAP